MKIKTVLFIMAACIIGLTANAGATTLFAEDFGGDLFGWTGTGGGSHNGEITADPLSAGNGVLHFTGLNSAGDIFTTSTSFSSTGNQFILDFDYLGTNNNSGGFIGYSYGLPGNHVWLSGSDTNYPGTSTWPDILIGDNTWNHYSIAFTSASSSIHLMLEDFIGSDNVAGNAYFDNIVLTDADGPDPIPEPTTILLLGSGLVGMLGFRKKFIV